MDTTTISLEQPRRSNYQIEPCLWHKRYSGFLSGYANSRVPKSMVDDLVQETFLAGLCSAKNFKFLCHEKYWLLSILKRKIIDYYRMANSKKGMLLKQSVSLTDCEPFIGKKASNSIENEIIAAELEKEITKAVKNLSPGRRNIFELRRQGVKTTEICELLDIKESYCWVEVSRARKNIKDHLMEHWYA